MEGKIRERITGVVKEPTLEGRIKSVHGIYRKMYMQNKNFAEMCIRDSTVIKNTLIRLALDGTGLEGMDSVLEGTSAIATSKEDDVAAARILGKYEEQIKTFKMKSGFIDKDVIGEEKLSELDVYKRQILKKPTTVLIL